MEELSLSDSVNRPDSTEAESDVLPQEYAYYDARNPVLLTEIVEGGPAHLSLGRSRDRQDHHGAPDCQ